MINTLETESVNELKSNTDSKLPIFGIVLRCSFFVKSVTNKIKFFNLVYFV